MDANRWNASWYQNNSLYPIINLGSYGTPIGTIGNFIKDTLQINTN